jgi:hypothetical protein
LHVIRLQHLRKSDGRRLKIERGREFSAGRIKARRDPQRVKIARSVRGSGENFDREHVGGGIGHLQEEQERERLMHSVEIGLLGLLGFRRVQIVVPPFDPAAFPRKAPLRFDAVRDFE